MLVYADVFVPVFKEKTYCSLPIFWQFKMSEYICEIIWQQ